MCLVFWVEKRCNTEEPWWQREREREPGIKSLYLSLPLSLSPPWRQSGLKLLSPLCGRIPSRPPPPPHRSEHRPMLHTIPALGVCPMRGKRNKIEGFTWEGLKGARNRGGRKIFAPFWFLFLTLSYRTRGSDLTENLSSAHIPFCHGGRYSKLSQKSCSWLENHEKKCFCVRCNFFYFILFYFEIIPYDII